MALVKNDIPILEYDTGTQAVIMPGHSQNYEFCDRAVMLFMEPEIDEYVKTHDCKKVGEFISVTKIFNVYNTFVEGTEITFVQAPLGGAGAVQVMEQLIAGGAKKIVAAGCCGALEEGNEGDYFIPTAALRQEGTSYHYLPPSREVELDEAVIKVIENTLDKENLPHRRCKTWTTDGFYRETKEMVMYRKSEGYSVVEMECASLAACAKFRGVSFAQLLFTADSLANVDEYDERNWGERIFATAMDLGMKAGARL